MTTAPEVPRQQTPRGTSGGVASVLEPLVSRVDAGSPNGRRFFLRFWDGSELPPTATEAGDDPPALVFRSRDALAYLVRAPGELGLSRAWVSGALDVDGDLEQALARTEDWRHVKLSASDAAAGLSAIRKLGLLRGKAPEPPQAEARLGGRRHSRGRDKEAISHHYDVSNSFYRNMLGETMVYSCAYFASPDDTIDQAQTRKLDLICRKLELQEGERLLDIGCGWGSLLIHAAKHYGVRAVGVTVAEEQAKLARERVREAGLEDSIEVRLQDYREVADGPYDKISSIGMFEHVGRGNLETYLTGVRDLLGTGGKFLNHGIVRTAQAKPTNRSFTTRYVFPDGELHTQGIVINALEDAGFEIHDDESLRPHYAETLRRWDEGLMAHQAETIAEIGAERERVWRLHNVGAALAFERGTLSVHQVIASPLRLGAPPPPLRVRAYDV